MNKKVFVISLSILLGFLTTFEKSLAREETFKAGCPNFNKVINGVYVWYNCRGISANIYAKNIDPNHRGKNGPWKLVTVASGTTGRIAYGKIGVIRSASTSARGTFFINVIDIDKRRKQESCRNLRRTVESYDGYEDRIYNSLAIQLNCDWAVAPDALGQQ